MSKMGWGEGGWGGDLVPICRVPLITSQKEEQALIKEEMAREVGNEEEKIYDLKKQRSRKPQSFQRQDV